VAAGLLRGLGVKKERGSALLNVPPKAGFSESRRCCLSPQNWGRMHSVVFAGHSVAKALGRFALRPVDVVLSRVVKMPPTLLEQRQDGPAPALRGRCAGVSWRRRTPEVVNLVGGQTAPELHRLATSRREQFLERGARPIGAIGDRWKGQRAGVPAGNSRSRPEANQKVAFNHGGVCRAYRHDGLASVLA